ncbi:MAG: methionine biosynthesis protein MetW [Spirochaetales bacterium]|nr:methionine biosynthesis protein MetW [Spirochaetales bacterium]
MNEQNFQSFSYEEIAKFVEPKSRVLDLGCGEGELLELLTKTKGVNGRGVDIEETMIVACISKGLSVFQGNLEEGLKDYPDKSYDFVILNQTLQMIHKPAFLLKEMVRVGKRVVVNFPNFGYLINRIQLGIGGTMPVNKNIPYQWFDTPNIHFCTRRDFFQLCKSLGIRIVDEIAIHKNRKIKLGKDIFASQICLLLEEI